MSLLVFGANAYQSGINRMARAQIREFNGGTSGVVDKAIAGVEMSAGQNAMESYVNITQSNRKISKMFNELGKMA